MLWSFQVTTSLWFGYELVTKLAHNNFDILQRFFAGVPIGFFTLAWMNFVLSSRRTLNQYISYITFAIQVISSFVLHRQNSSKRLSLSIKFSLLQLATLLAFGSFYVILMYISMLQNNIYTKGAGYGDLPFHLNIISSFACGCNNKRSSIYDVHSSFFAGENLAYPFIPNFLTGMLMATGRASLSAALFFPSAFIILSFFYGQYSLCYKFTNDHFACLISVFLFVNLGGLGWVKWITDKNRGYGDWLHNWGKNQYEYWFHPLFHIIVPQRASLWSFPLCYWTIYSLILGIEKNNLKLMFLAGILTGLTPLVQVHSYVSMAQWSISYCIITFGLPLLFNYKQYSLQRLKSQFLLWLVFAITANILAAPQFYPYLNRLETAKNQFIQLKPIWVGRFDRSLGTVKSFLLLWWRGLGVFFFISIFAGFALLTKQQLKYYIPSLVVFVVTNIIRYQPWELDNTKLFYGGWIPIALPVVGQYMAKLARKPWTFVIFLIFLFSSCLSCVLHSYDCLISKVPLFDREDIKFGLWLAENTKTKAIFLTSNWHAHPAATIAGRQLFMGYGGWIISHGLDYERNNVVNQLFNNPHNIRLFRNNNITYVISRNHEKNRFEQNCNPNWFAKIFENNNYIVYKLK